MFLSCPLLISDFVILTHFIFNVKHFLKVFWIVFKLFELFQSCFFWSSFIILPQCLWFVNNFFWFFSKSFLVVERRWRDLNPRAGRPTYTLSRGASSATWVHLLAWKLATKVFDFHCYWSAITSVRGLVYQKNFYLSSVFFNFF